MVQKSTPRLVGPSGRAEGQNTHEKTTVCVSGHGDAPKPPVLGDVCSDTAPNPEMLSPSTLGGSSANVWNDEQVDDGRSHSDHYRRARSGGVCDGICSACLRTSGKAFRSTKVGLGAADGESETEAGGGAMVFGPVASWWTCLANAAKLL